MKNYTQQFEKTVLRFCKNAKLMTPHLVVAASGGVDSMALSVFAAYLLKNKKIKSLRILHINHQTRPECSLEVKIVEKFARKIGAEFLSYEVENLSLDDPSFENKARLKRQAIFQEVSDKLSAQYKMKVRVWCAHHIDDSFEWSLKQRLSSSVFKRQYGIACKTPLVCRPFMSVTKEQIFKYATSHKLEWKNDLSNLDTRFERGYLRELIIPAIKKKYPQYLKHYVRQMEIEKAKFILYKASKFHTVLCWPHHSIPKQIIRKSVTNFSQKTRGKLTDQLQKIELMLKSGKSGPLDMSGGVKVYNLSHCVIITDREAVTKFRAASFELVESKAFNAASFQDVFERADYNFSNLWVALDDESHLSAFKGGHALLPHNMRNCCNASNKVIVSSWKVLRHLMHNPSKKIKIALIVQID